MFFIAGVGVHLAGPEEQHEPRGDGADINSVTGVWRRDCSSQLSHFISKSRISCLFMRKGSTVNHFFSRLFYFCRFKKLKKISFVICLTHMKYVLWRVLSR